MKNTKEDIGITLIALVITIIVLLILAGISINMLSGDNSILERTKSAKQESNRAKDEELIKIAISSARVTENGKLSKENLSNEFKKIYKDSTELQEAKEYWYYKGYTISKEGKIEEYNSLLPDEYQEVEYIATNGTEYIDTNITLNGNSRIKVRFKTPDEIDRNHTSTVFYSGNNSDITGFAFCTTSTNGKYRAFLYYPYDGTEEMSNSTVYTVDINKNKFYLNGDLLKTFNKREYENPYTMPLFGQYYLSKNIINKCQAGTKIYYCQIWKDDDLKRDLVACYRKADNKPGLYDLVENVFYTNLGNGEFITGREIN